MLTDDVVQHERKRLQALYRYDVLDTEPESAFDCLTRIGSALFRTPICAVSLVDEYRVWTKSITGFEAGDTPREDSICNNTIQTSERLLVVPDASANPEFSSNPFVAGEPHIRFYAGASLVSVEGAAIGTFCVIGFEPRVSGLKPEETTMLTYFASLAINLMDARLERRILRDTERRLNLAQSQLMLQIAERDRRISSLEQVPPA